MKENREQERPNDGTYEPNRQLFVILTFCQENNILILYFCNMTRQLPLGSCLYSVTVCFYLNITSFISFSRSFSLSKSATSWFLALKEGSMDLGPPKKMCKKKLCWWDFQLFAFFAQVELDSFQFDAKWLFHWAPKSATCSALRGSITRSFVLGGGAFYFQRTKLKLNHKESNFTSHAI